MAHSNKEVTLKDVLMISAGLSVLIEILYVVMLLCEDVTMEDYLCLSICTPIMIFFGLVLINLNKTHPNKGKFTNEMIIVIIMILLFVILILGVKFMITQGFCL